MRRGGGVNVWACVQSAQCPSHPQGEEWGARLLGCLRGRAAARQDCCLASEGKTAQLWTPFLSMLVKRDGVCQSFLDAEFRVLLRVPGEWEKSSCYQV